MNEWHSMDTAPRDGFHFIGLVRHGGVQTAMQVYYDKGWKAAFCPCCGTFSGDFIHADGVSAWMPLPAPPK